MKILWWSITCDKGEKIDQLLLLAQQQRNELWLVNQKMEKIMATVSEDLAAAKVISDKLDVAVTALDAIATLVASLQEQLANVAVPVATQADLDALAETLSAANAKIDALDAKEDGILPPPVSNG